MARSVSTPGSPDYRKYLAPGQFARTFGPTPATIAAVDKALTSRGLHPGTVSGNGLAIPVTTTAGAATAAFDVHLNHVRLASGRVAYANDRAPSLPASVAPSVSSVLGLDDLSQLRPQYTTSPATPGPAPASAAPASATAAPAAPASAAPASAAPAGATSTPAATAGPQPCTSAKNAANADGGYTANQIAQAYSFGGLYSQNTLGAGVTVAIYELASYNPSDIAAFQSCYGTSATVTDIAVDGGPHPTDPGAIEVELDIEGVISMAPKANIEVYLGPNGPNTYDIYNKIVSDDTAKVVTTSWGGCEATLTAAEANQENTLFEQAAVQGQTVLAAAGDSGSEDCDGETTGSTETALEVDDPGSQPFVTDVGGTSLTAIAASPTETVWNDAAQQVGAGGGGISQFWSMPPAQHGPGVINAYSSNSTCQNQAGTYCREVPDVSASADPAYGYMVYYTGSETGVTGWQPIGGTSAAAPLWAALVALANEGCSCSLGFVNAALYDIAASGSGSFNDITTGNNDYLGNHAGAYPATAGYDMASGLGSPIATTLVAQLDTRPMAPVLTADSPPGGYVASAYTYTFAATGTPTPTFSTTGTLPPGLSLNGTTGVLSGTPTATGDYTFTLAAKNGDGSPAVAPNLQIAIGPPLALPGFSSANSASFVVSVSASYQIVATGNPVPTVLESGALPPGVNYNQATGFLEGAPSQGSAGTYSISFVATNSIGQATQAFTITVSQASFTYPTNGQSGVDTTKAFTWSTIPQAIAYDVIVGTTQYGSNLVSSGVLSASTSSLSVPALPSGPTLYATLFAEIIPGVWSYEAVSFTALPGEATFTSPLNGQAGVDPTRAFTWSTIPQGQAYDLVVGTSKFGSNVLSSGVLPASQASYSGPVLPSGETLYATLLTEVNGAFTRFQAITFVAGPAMGTLTLPVNGQEVATPTTFTWSTIAAAQNYDLVVGTTLYGTNLVSSGVLSPTTSSFSVPALPAGETLYATLLTELNGKWTFQAITFTSG